MKNLSDERTGSDTKKRIGTIVFYFVILFICGFAVARIYTANKAVSSLSATTKKTNSLYDSETLNVYAGPGKYYGEIGTIKAFTDIVVTGRRGNALESTLWVAFDFNGKEGWIDAYFLDIDGNVNKLPLTSSTNDPVPLSSVPITTGEAYSVYAGPDENYEVIGQLESQSKIVATGRHIVVAEGQRKTWVTFNFNGKQGWIVDYMYSFGVIEVIVLRLPETDYVSTQMPIETSVTPYVDPVLMQSPTPIKH